MKSAEQIEQSVRRLNIGSGTEARERTLRDLIKVHTQHKETPSAAGRWNLRRTIMMHGTRRMAAVLALALVLIVTLGVGTGALAFGQGGHALNATLAWLRQAVVGLAPGEPSVEVPTVPERTTDADPKEVCYAARFLMVPQGETGVWQSLQDQGIEFTRVSADPDVCYVALTRAQAESFDASVALRCLSAPRVTVSAGDLATMALTDSDPQKGRQGFALGLLPILSGNGTEVQSTISFHDGHNGFEIPNVSTESGGVVLIRAKGMFPDFDKNEEQDGRSSRECLIRIGVNVQ